jgi:hypothetical protein
MNDTITAWLLAGGTGGAAAFTTARLYRKCRKKKLNCKETNGLESCWAAMPNMSIHPKKPKIN